MSDAAKVQQMPVTNFDSRDVLDDLIATHSFAGPLLTLELKEQLEDRVSLGVRKYGTRLQSHNGRDVVMDVRQELLDGIMYSHQAVMQGVRIAHIRDMLIRMVRELDSTKAAHKREGSL